MNPLFWWIWQTSASVLVLTVLVSLASMALKYRPAWRHALWLVVLIKLVTPPIVSWPWSVDEIANGVTAPQPNNARDTGVNVEAWNSTRLGTIETPRQEDEPVAEGSVPVGWPRYILSSIQAASTQRQQSTNDEQKSVRSESDSPAEEPRKATVAADNVRATALGRFMKLLESPGTQLELPAIEIAHELV